MVGGDEAALERVRPLLDLMAKTVVRQGGPGAGQHAKLVNQILIATGMIGVCEALLYGYRAGLDLDQVLRSVAGGAAGSWSLSNYGPRMLRGELDPGFMVEHFVKDMAIALAEARRLNLSLPGLALAQQLYVALMAQGHGRLGTHSLILALARLSDVDWLEPTAHLPKPRLPVSTRRSARAAASSSATTFQPTASIASRSRISASICIPASSRRSTPCSSSSTAAKSSADRSGASTTFAPPIAKARPAAPRS